MSSFGRNENHVENVLVSHQTLMKYFKITNSFQEFSLFNFHTEMKKSFVDVIVVMGSSSNENFEKQKQTAQEAVQQDTNSDIIYGVIQYGKSAEVLKTLQEKMNKQTFEQFIPLLTWSEVGEAFLEALQKASVTFAEYGRPNARRILVVFSDRPWNDSMAVEDIGDRMRKNGVKIVPISVGNRSDDERLPELGGRKPLTVDEDKGPEKTGKKVAEEIMKGTVVPANNSLTSPSPVVSFQIVNFVLLDPCFSKDCGPNSKCKLQSDDSVMCGKLYKYMDNALCLIFSR